MDSADPPLAVHGLYAGRDHQYRRHSTEEVHEHDGPVSGGPARLTVCHRPVFVRAAVCHQVAQRATHRLNAAVTYGCTHSSQKRLEGHPSFSPFESKLV